MSLRTGWLSLLPLIRPVGCSKLLGVLATLLLGACDVGGAPDSPPSPGFRQIDSAGVLVSITPGSEAQAKVGWRVDSIADLVLGARDSPSEGFYRIQGLRGTPDGGVVVVDGSSRELRFFDAGGRLERRVGRRGEGPGEFGDPVLVSTAGQDSLVVWDVALLRFQVFSMDGQESRTIRLTTRWPAGARPPVGAVGMRMLVESSDLSHLLSRRAGPREVTVQYLWVDPTGEIESEITSISVVRLYHSSGGGRWSSGLSGIPFTVGPSASVTEGGAFIADGVSAEIRGYDLQGSLRRVFRVDAERRPVTSDLIEAEVAERAAATNASRDFLEWLFSQMPIPDTLPAFQALQLDELGWLWAEVYDFDPRRPRQWVVFDAEGRAQGTVETPAGLEIQWIGRDAILGVWRDEFDVEYVRRYPLDRRAGAPGADPEG